MIFTLIEFFCVHIRVGPNRLDESVPSDTKQRTLSVQVSPRLCRAFFRSGLAGMKLLAFIWPPRDTTTAGCAGPVCVGLVDREPASRRDRRVVHRMAGRRGRPERRTRRTCRVGGGTDGSGLRAVRRVDRPYRPRLGAGCWRSYAAQRGELSRTACPPRQSGRLGGARTG